LRSLASRRRWLAAGALLAAAVLGLVFYLATLAQVQQRHADAAEAFATALERTPGSAAQRLAQLPMLAAAAGAEVRVDDGDGRRLADLAAAAAPTGQAEHRMVNVQGQWWRLSVRAPVLDLWRLHWLASGLLAGGALVTLVLAGALDQRRRRRLQSAVAATLAQARSLGEAGYVAPRALAMVEMRPLVLAMDHLHQRMRALFDVHAEQLEALRRQAHTDAVTGLPNRRHFLAVLEAVLGSDGAPAEAGLVLVRLADLQGMNQRLGTAATDRLLQSLAEVLASYPQRTERCAVGRLTGGEFALLLPAGGVAHETAQSLLQALRAQLVRVDPAARVMAGAVELRPPLGAAQALVMAQAALASAESAAASRADTAADQPRLVLRDPHEEEVAWQRQLARALVQGRVQLGAYPVRRPDGRQLMLDCPLRVQLQPDGAYEPASRWLTQAKRSKLNAAVDEKAVMLALAAIAHDGEARCVNIAAASAMSGDFVAALSRRLEAARSGVDRLWLDLPESLALEQPELVRELASRWRPLGTRLALEHCGEGLLRVPRLIELGLDCVRIDGRFVNGIAAERADDARHYLRGLVRLVQSVGLSVTAESVRAPEDLELLWRMGFDGATGPAVLLDRVPA
jgi:diguanylate cyclase (GGDEF)-like protein